MALGTREVPFHPHPPSGAGSPAAKCPAGGSVREPQTWAPGLYLAFSVISRAGAFPALPCVVESAVEKLRTVTSCHDSKTPGRSLRHVQEQRPGRGRLSACLGPARSAARGPLGGRGAGDRPAHSWPGRRARRAPCASSWLRAGWLRAPRAGGGAWPGRRAPSHWPFVLLLCPSPSPSRAAPAPAPRRCPGKVCVPWPSRAVETLCAAVRLGKLSCWGLFGSSVPEGGRLRAGHRDRLGAGKCASATGRREGGRPGSGRRPASPGPWPPDKGVLEVVAEAHFIFPQQGLVKGKKEAKHTFVSPAGRGVRLRGSRGARGVCSGG